MSDIKETSASSDPKPPVADQPSRMSGWSGSFFLETIKAQSASIRDVCARDLNEFVTVIGHDTASTFDAVQRNLSQATHTLGSLVSADNIATDAVNVNAQPYRIESVLSHWTDQMSNVLSNVLSIAPAVPASPSTAAVTRLDALIQQLQRNKETYTLDPMEDAALKASYQEYCTSFHLVDHSKDISTLFSSNEQVRALHTRVVPYTLSHEEWWKRYFFRLQQLRQSENEKKAVIMAHSMATDETVENEIDQWQEDTEPIEIKNDFKDCVKSNEDLEGSAVLVEAVTNISNASDQGNKPQSKEEYSDWVEWE